MQLDQLKTFLDSIFDGAYAVDRERRFLYWNEAAERITGYSRQDVDGERCADGRLCHIDDTGRRLCDGPCPLSRAMRDGEPREARVFLHHKDGHRLPVDVRCVPLRDELGEIVGALELFRAASRDEDLQARLQELEHQALVDPVTGIGNRRHAEQILARRIDELKRYGWRFALIIADVDGFKGINDNYGHEVGDQALRMVAETLAHNVRPSDFVGRWGGDEFVVIMPRIDTGLLRRVSERLRILVGESFLTLEDRRRVGVTVSLGATLAKPDEAAADVVARADECLHDSKAEGKNRLTTSR